MKKVARSELQPAVLAALETAFSEHGSCALDLCVPQPVWWDALTGPAVEFLSRPGKELRTSLVDAGCCLAGNAEPSLTPKLALLIEVIHAGSLIIDDVEDGSTHRRGAPTLHKIFDTPRAINTGSWMYFWALAEVARFGLTPERELAIYRATCATLERCHRGQALDLAARVGEIAPADVPSVVATTTRLKTGTLCSLATSLGAISTGAPRPVTDAIGRFGTAVGTALQMLDDLGSLTAPSRRDKGREDLRNQRPTWPWAWFAETRPFMWSRVVELAVTSRGDDELDGVADVLATEIGEHGRGHIQSVLDDAIADLIAVVGNASAIAKIGAVLSHLETSYG